MPTITLDARRRWRTWRVGDVVVHSVGDRSAADRIAAALSQRDRPAADGLVEALRGLPTNFATIVSSSRSTVAATDRVRSHPIFYRHSTRAVSNDAWHLVGDVGTEQLDAVGLMEMAMVGYVTGPGTIVADLRQLQAGELLVWNNAEPSPRRERYYSYVPTPDRYVHPEDLLDRLESVVDTVFTDVIERAGGRPFVVPLSGGYDSRLVLAKLTELGADVSTFSYGPAGNHEARLAERIAERLGVSWTFVPSATGREARRQFATETRRDYWRYADGLSSVPSMLEYQAMACTPSSGALRDDAIVVNGQSGDFITGGHVPATLWDAPAPSEEDMLTAIVDKHYSLWSDLRTPDRLRRAHQRIREVLPFQPDGSRESLVSAYESWEYQERQCKWVINGQRLYEFLGLDWQLPLWDGRFVDFWGAVPFALKYQQRLFSAYLRRYDFREVFSTYPRADWTWPVHQRWVVPVARMAGLVFGARWKRFVYDRMMYFGSSYANQLAMHGMRKYWSLADRARNPVSLATMAWFEERKLPWPRNDE